MIKIETLTSEKLGEQKFVVIPNTETLTDLDEILKRVQLAVKNHQNCNVNIEDLGTLKAFHDSIKPIMGTLNLAQPSTV